MQYSQMVSQPAVTKTNVKLDAKAYQVAPISNIFYYDQTNVLPNDCFALTVDIETRIKFSCSIFEGLCLEKK